VNHNPVKNIGLKRNELIRRAVELGSEYIAFIDDDDLPSKDYIKEVMNGVNAGADCCSLKGQIYFSGVRGMPFLHSIKYTEWYQDRRYYYRMPNHLNCIKLDLVKDIPFQETNFGEDGNWSYDIRNAGVLKTEHTIDHVIYHYFSGNKTFTETEFNKEIYMASKL